MISDINNIHPSLLFRYIDFCDIPEVLLINKACNQKYKNELKKNTKIIGYSFDCQNEILINNLIGKAKYKWSKNIYVFFKINNIEFQEWIQYFNKYTKCMYKIKYDDYIIRSMSSPIFDRGWPIVSIYNGHESHINYAFASLYKLFRCLDTEIEKELLWGFSLERTLVDEIIINNKLYHKNIVKTKEDFIRLMKFFSGPEYKRNTFQKFMNAIADILFDDMKIIHVYKYFE